MTRTTNRFRLALAEVLIGSDMESIFEELRVQVRGLATRTALLEAQVIEAQGHNRRLAGKLMERCDCCEGESCEICRVVYGIPERLHG